MIRDNNARLCLCDEIKQIGCGQAAEAWHDNSIRIAVGGWYSSAFQNDLFAYRVRRIRRAALDHECAGRACCSA